MRKTWKKAISILSILVLLAILFAGAIPVSAFQEENPPVNAKTAASTIQDIVTAYTEINAEDISSLEKLQNDILNVTEIYEALPQEDQALLSESMRYVQMIAAEIENMYTAADSVRQGESINPEEDGVENSWRYLNGEAVSDVLEVIDNEAHSVSGQETGEDILYNSQGDEDASNDDIAASLNADTFDYLIGNGTTYQGIDVSRHQGYIDWQQVKNAGIAFAIIRCGYGGNITSQDDSQWEYNASSCESLGIPYGVYLYSYAENTSEIDGEVQHTLRLLQGHKPTLPVYIDIEENIQFALGGSVLSTLATRFCSQIKNAGYKSGLYTSRSHWNTYFGTFAAQPAYFHWVAEYNSACNYSGRYEAWQYTSTGRVNGITGNVDRDIWYGRLDRPTPEDIPPTPTNTPTPKPTYTPTPRPTYTPTPKPTYTPTPKPTSTPKPKPTVTPKPTSTPKPKPTVTPKPTPTPTDAPIRFSDVQDSNHPFYKAIYWAAKAGITKGYSDGTFGINRECTRSEAVMFLWKMAGSPAPVDALRSPFSDVSKSHPHYRAILWAAQRGITKGFSDGTFGIYRTCTRGQIMTFIWRFKGQPAPNPASRSPFRDVPKNHVFYKAILWGAQNKVTNGFSDGTFGINKDCTRGQIVTFLYRIR